MQLAKIKMSGFKSFVDPTAILLPSQLVAIVGPNGCGKSNVIDAVTWVMGESSPKYLRGEALTDVIFNGSTARKPVGQASVELIFDNTDGSIGGEYAKYSEISIKRLINRESDSQYFLNGVRCRKRDVVSLFLGTGIGPRSYSIIGQNMINRVIESKPEELRTYLEEAAGISKYKDRRHETELRINHAKDNLARVNDLRAELDKQLSHLKQQANAAEKYKSLKQQERILRAELYAIQWRQLDSLMVDHTLKLQCEETALEARNSDLIKTDREIEQLRHEQRVAHDAYQEIQRRYYAVGNEITRIEQDVLHHKERQHQWEEDLKQIENACDSIKNEMSETDDNLQELEHDIRTIEPQTVRMREEVELLQKELKTAEESAQTLENHWDEFNQISSQTARTAQGTQMQIEHLEERLRSYQKRQEQLKKEESSNFNFSHLLKEIDDFSNQSRESANQLAFHQQQLHKVKDEINQLQSREVTSYKELDKIRSETQCLLGQQASWEALQQTALGHRDHQTLPWLKQHQLDNKPRLAQHIEVEKGWELAVEKVLGFNLQALCVEEISDIANDLDDFKSGNLCVFAARCETPAKAPSKNSAALLIHKVKSPWQLDSLLAHIYVADSIEAALKLCKSLKSDESVITKDGVWLNPSWLKVLREEDPAAGLFQREQELKELALRIDQLQKAQKTLEKTIQERKEKIAEFEIQRDQLQEVCNQQQAQSHELNAQQKIKQGRLAELKNQAEKCKAEQKECREQCSELSEELAKSKIAWEIALKDLSSEANMRDTLIKERDKMRQQIHTKRDVFNKKKDSLHELQIRFQTSKSQKDALKQTQSRLQKELASLNERKISLQSELSSMQPLDILNKALSRALDKHVNVEVELNMARVSVEALDQEFRHLEEKRQSIERDIHKIRNILETLRLEWQSWKVKADTLIEQMKETELKIEDILKDLDQDITVEEWKAKLDQVLARINRLGPINLVAIDEYTTCLERKEYLDLQVEDLQSGLVTLEEAINKIDRETRARFKETFEKVNEKFQDLFPTIFGGGKAYLELTSDNLLEAGITLMACPPGKRNSSIYLLSGGEKSLTAIAFIFSIFSLNPAPFCLLDEVDAALDDANVVRFTRLVKAMAEKTQFIFISHNKITIEMAEHLIGVTMNEPGVSRLVSVDIEKAIGMAES